MKTQAKELFVHVYTDSSYADCKDTCKSTAGFCTFLNNNLISWGSPMLPTVGLSVAESELMAACEGAKDGLFTINLLGEVLNPSLKIEAPAKLFMDNTAAQFMAQNPVNSKRTKHIAVKFHFLRQKVQEKIYRILHVDTHENVADYFTKILDGAKFMKFSRMLLGYAAKTTEHCCASCYSCFKQWGGVL